MKFFKNNSYDIVKLFINQIGIAIFSMALNTAILIAVPDTAGTSVWISRAQVVLSIGATAFYLVLIYLMMWEIGAKDAIRIESGKMSPVPAKGAWMGLMANVPNFLLTGVALVCMLIGIYGGVQTCSSIAAVLNLFFGFLESMYLGVIINIFPIDDASAAATNICYLYRTVLYFVMPLISVAAASIAYYMGTKNKRIFPAKAKKRPE